MSAQLERVFIPVYTLGFPFDLLGSKKRYGLSCQPMLKTYINQPVNNHASLITMKEFHGDTMM